MKRLFLFLISASVLLSCSQKSTTPELVSVLIRDYWGYINCKGEMVIAPQFESAFPFSDGLALVETEDNGYCFVNKKGQFAKGLQGFHYATPFSEELAVVVRTFGCPEVVNTSGKVLFKLPEAETAYPFSEGLCLFSKEVMVQDEDGKEEKELRYGFVNTSGKVVIAPTFKDACPFKNGVAVAASDDGLYGFIDNKGKWVIQPAYSNVSNFSEGLAAVQDKSTRLWGYVDKKGTLKVMPQFETCGFFKEGLAYVTTRSDLSGYINKKGKFVIQPQFEAPDDYSSVFDFSDGLAVGFYDIDAGKGGYINKKGTVVIPGLAGFPFNGPLTAAANLTDSTPHFGIIDKKGNFVVAPVYEMLLWDFNSDFCYDNIPEFVRTDYEDMSWLQSGGEWFDNPDQYICDTYTFDTTTMTVKKYLSEQDKTIDGTYSFKNHETVLLTFKKEPSEELKLDRIDQRIKVGDEWYFSANGTAYEERLRREFKLTGGEWYCTSSSPSNPPIWCFPVSYYRGSIARSITFYEFPEGSAGPNDEGFSLSSATRTASFTVEKGRELHQSGSKVADIELLLSPYYYFRITGDDWFSGDYTSVWDMQ